MGDEEALLDANVFMYAAGGPHRYRAPCRRIVRDLGDGSRRVGRWSAVVDAELFQELAYRYTSIGKPAVGRELQRGVRALGLPVVPIDEDVVGAFVELQRAHHDSLAARAVSVRDLLHVAVMQVRGIRAIITADKDFDALPNVVRIDPEHAG